MLHIHQLTKRRGSKDILKGIDFEVKSGRVTGFLGPNGAGKSSTLRILLGLDKATSGKALIQGLPYAKLPSPLSTVGAVFECSGAHRMRTGRAHLNWIAKSAGIARTRVEEVLELVGLSHAAAKRVGSYSLGMGRRLGIAAALLGDPDILILDEPTNGLDPEGIRWMRTFLRERAATGRTVLLSSHLMGETAETVDDLVIIHQGRIVSQGTLADVVGASRTLEDAFFAITSQNRGDRT